MGNMVKVGMADMNCCHAPDAITTLGLGSCVGVVLYDSNKKIAGLVHVMLPDSKKINNNENKAKFADTGIDEMIRQVVAAGASRMSLKAKIAGDTGKSYGRTIEFYPETDELLIKAVGKAVYKI